MISINIYEIIMQMVNFLILMWLLKRFVYTPLINFLDKRAADIQNQISEADENQKKSQDLLEEQKKILQEARNEARNLRKKAEESGENERENVLNNAKIESNRLIENAKKEIELDIILAREELIKKTGDLVTLLTEKIMKIKLTEAEKQEFINESLKEMSLK